MNARCLSCVDDYTPFDHSGGEYKISMDQTELDDELGCGQDEAFDRFEGDGSFEAEFEERDSVERHALRRASVEAGIERLKATSAAQVVALLTWTATHLPGDMRRFLAETLRREGEEDARGGLALWRAGAASRGDLHAAGRALLDTARIELAHAAPPLERVHQLHLVLLAIRHAALELDEVAEQTVELWQEKLRSELTARQREMRTRGIRPRADHDSAETALLLAAVSELWRDTAPAARSLRLPLEQLSRLAWHAARQGNPGRAERAALLIAAGNQCLDDLPLLQMEAGLYASACDVDRTFDATWVGGRRPDDTVTTADFDPHAEALVIRALSGPARTGPRPP